MVMKVERWAAEDGTLFETEQQARAYEKFVMTSESEYSLGDLEYENSYEEPEYENSYEEPEYEDSYESSY